VGVARRTAPPVNGDALRLFPINARIAGDSFDWTLIAPLYYGAEDVGPTTVQVLDLERGQVIVELEIPRTGD